MGTWRGEGQGSYPTISSFGYVEEITFSHVGKPFLSYTQKTRDRKTDLPLHAESGYLRLVGPAKVELVLAHPTGILEALAGSFQANSADGHEGGLFDLASTEVVGTATSVPVDSTSRVITVAGDILSYDFAMAAAGQPHTHHLSAELRRV